MSAPRVVLASGHMVDSPERLRARFPPGQVERVRGEVRTALIRWKVGPGTTVISGGARGADLIVAEEGRALGAGVVLCLAKPPEEFVKDSVALPGSDWTERFERALQAGDVRVLPADKQPATQEDVYARTNEWMIAEAGAMVGPDERPHAIIVWNGEGGDGPGGTRHFVQQLGFEAPDERITVIDPTPRSYERRQDEPGPKRCWPWTGGDSRRAQPVDPRKDRETPPRAKQRDPGLGRLFRLLRWDKHRCDHRHCPGPGEIRGRTTGELPEAGHGGLQKTIPTAVVAIHIR